MPFEKREVNGEIWGDLLGECVRVSEMDADARAVYALKFAAGGLDVKSYESTINRDFTSYDPKKFLITNFFCWIPLPALQLCR